MKSFTAETYLRRFLGRDFFAVFFAGFFKFEGRDTAFAFFTAERFKFRDFLGRSFGTRFGFLWTLVFAAFFCSKSRAICAFKAAISSAKRFS